MTERLVLQPRLAKLAQLVPEGSRLADIGTDHGYLPVWLLQEGKIPSAIAADIGREPLAHAQQTAAIYQLADKISFRLCSGLSQISPEEVDTVVLAGMGGDTIRMILEEAPWLTQGDFTLLLQPMSKSESLRPWLVSHGYTICEETLVADKGILYPILTVKAGEGQELTAVEVYVGRFSLSDPLAESWLAERQNRLGRMIEGLQMAQSETQREKLQPLQELMTAIQQKREQLL